MPVISRFYGMVIKIYFISHEHNPPHIHVIYGEYTSVIRIDNFKVMEGDLPIRALKIVTEWMEIHQKELMEIWETQKFKKIKPLI